MSAHIRTVEDHKIGSFHVDVELAGIRRRFESVMDATKWLRLMKVSGDIANIMVELREVVITAKRQLAYESCYVL